MGFEILLPLCENLPVAYSDYSVSVVVGIRIIVGRESYLLSANTINFTNTVVIFHLFFLYSHSTSSTAYVHCNHKCLQIIVNMKYI